MSHSIFSLNLPSLAVLLGLLSVNGGYANNIQITSPTLTGNTGTTALVQFNLSWENSWRGGGVGNWDAAWIFVKYKTIGGLWQHVRVSNTGHTAPAGSQIDLGLRTPGATYDAVNNPVDGVFIHRSATGTGNLSLTGVQLLWNYSSLGITYNDIIQVQVFGIEMVYVPQGSFYLGDGAWLGQGDDVSGHFAAGNTSDPFLLTGEGALTLGGAPTTNLGNNNAFNMTNADDFNFTTTKALPAIFPKGYNAVYCMKYEITQQQYVDFLNTLTYVQQNTHTFGQEPNGPAGSAAFYTNGYRNYIQIQTPGVANSNPAVYACNADGDAIFGEANDGKEVACGRLNWGGVAAYLDWSALRPMTELEFEKACRGPLPALTNEYPWGTTGITSVTYTLSNPGASNEGIATNYSTTVGNAVYGTNQFGPVRVGCFAAHASNTGRITAGATYFGIMEMGGNVDERCVNVGTVEGRAFAGNHGSGGLGSDGYADQSTWPIVGSVGIGTRGGGYNSVSTSVTLLRISDRKSAAQSSGYNYPWEGSGGRGVRTAP